MCGMSVNNIFSSEMYHNEQWCMIHHCDNHISTFDITFPQWCVWCMTHHCGIVISENVSKIILLMKEHNKKAKYVDILVSCYGCTSPHPPRPLPGDFSVGPGVQASNAGINLTGYHPPGHPGAFAPKCVPSPRASAQQKMPGGRANK